jgi:hypothetical protein
MFATGFRSFLDTGSISHANASLSGFRCSALAIFTDTFIFRFTHCLILMVERGKKGSGAAQEHLAFGNEMRNRGTA